MSQAYYSAVSFTDSHIGKLLAELDSLGLRETTLVAVMGDHGKPMAPLLSPRVFFFPLIFGLRFGFRWGAVGCLHPPMPVVSIACGGGTNVYARSAPAAATIARGTTVYDMHGAPHAICNWNVAGWQLGEMNEWRKMTNFELGVRVPLIVRMNLLVAPPPPLLFCQTCMLCVHTCTRTCTSRHTLSCPWCWASQCCQLAMLTRSAPERSFI